MVAPNGVGVRVSPWAPVREQELQTTVCSSFRLIDASAGYDVAASAEFVFVVSAEPGPVVSAGRGFAVGTERQHPELFVPVLSGDERQRGGLLQVGAACCGSVGPWPSDPAEDV